MNEIEDRLRKLPLPPVPASLDARVRRTLCQERPPLRRLAIPLWTCAAGCALFFLAGAGLAWSVRKPPVVLVASNVVVCGEASTSSFRRIVVPPEPPPERYFQRPKSLGN